MPSAGALRLELRRQPDSISRVHEAMTATERSSRLDDLGSSSMIPHNRPLISDADREAVDAVLGSGWIAAGEQVAGLEADMAAGFGGGGACAASSGTSALYLALKVLGVGEGDVVAVPTYSCSALLDAVLAVGSAPLIVDVAVTDFTIDPSSLKRERRGRRLAATIAVHTHGARARLEELTAAGSGRIIQDCCHSLGGRHQGQLIGHDGPLSVFSFYATKIITCGQGGLLYDPDGALANAARHFRDTETRPVYTPRFNVQLTDFQAAMARSQWRRLDAIAERRREIARRYLSALPAGVLAEPRLVDAERLVHRFVVRAHDADERQRFRTHLHGRGVQAAEPIQHDDLLHHYMRLDPERFPVSEALADTTLSLPLYPALSDAQVATVAEAIATLPA